MVNPARNPILALALLLLAGLMIAVASRWRRPHAAGRFQSHACTGVWILGLGLLAAGAVSALRAALGLAMGDAVAAPPWDLLLRGEVVAGLGGLLLLGFSESEAGRGRLLAVAAVGAALGAALSAPLETLGLRLEPGPLAAAAAAALLAPVLLSAGSRVSLVRRIREAASDLAGDQLLVLDAAGRLLHATDPARRALGLQPAGGTRADLPQALRQLVRDEQARRARLRTQAGRVLEAFATGARSDRRTRARGILLRDVTGRYEDERRLVRLAHYDSLTGLANRRLFLETLAKVLEDAARASSRVGLFYIDLDDFKTINDSFGHGAGDRLLEALAERFRTHLRPQEVVRFGISGPPLSVARLSGDEFAVIAPRLPDALGAVDLASWILELIARPIELADRVLNASASVGIAISPEDGRDLDTLIRHADTALYAAKSKGRRRYARYEASFDEKADRARRLEDGLRTAIERDELRLFYQPKIAARSGRVNGFEALMRWHNAELGDVGPAEFIPVAEDRGLITTLGTWALHRACRQLREWRESGFEPVPVAVNVSSHQFNEVDLQSVVSEALKEHDVDPHLLELELTESLLLGEGDHVELVLRDLRSIGVRIALDDFGTGYSALTYLNRFNLDVLKMDRGLLRDIDTNPAALGIVSAVVSMAHSLGLTVVAEGVDCEEQVPILRDMLCDEIQGFLYSPALPPEEAVRFLARAGEPAPVCPGQVESPGTRAREAATLEIEQDDAPVLREPTPIAVEPQARAASHAKPNRGRVLVVDDGEGTLGPTALRLNRLGVDIHYASAVDEAHLFVNQEGEEIRAVVAPPGIELAGLGSVVKHLSDRCGERRRVIVIGERPGDEVRSAIRAAEVDWVLWAPFKDVELRCLTKGAMALSSELADRREPRVPVDLVASLSAGNRREMVVVSSLSPRGAFLETSDLLPVGSSLRLEMDMPTDRFRGFARVVHVQYEDPEHPQEPSGMGVAFFGSDRQTERILRKAVKELEARYLP